MWYRKDNFYKSLTADEKKILAENRTLVKEYSRQSKAESTTGKLLFEKIDRTYNVKKIDKWKTISKRGNFYGISTYDEFGYPQSDTIFSMDGRPEWEAVYYSDSLDGKKILIHDVISRYSDTRTIWLKFRTIIMDGKDYKHGTWLYFSKTGEIEKTEEYYKNRRIRRASR